MSDVDAMDLNELRMAIAERLGYRYYWYTFLNQCYLRDLGVQNTSGMTTFNARPAGIDINMEFVPDWPTEMAAADALLDDLDRRGWHYELASVNGYQLAIIGDAEGGHGSWYGWGAIRPEAISRAWLKAVLELAIGLNSGPGMSW